MSQVRFFIFLTNHGHTPCRASVGHCRALSGASGVRVGQVSGTVGHCRARSGSSWISFCNHLFLSLFAFWVCFVSFLFVFKIFLIFVYFCVVWVPFEWIPCVSTYFLLMFVDSDGKQCFACSWRRVCYLLYVF